MESIAVPSHQRSYRSDIDGLRALAILPVVLFHAGVRQLSGGFTGVDIFFVISGYLIGGNIYGDVLRGTFRYATFYQRRAKRILPALYVVLLALLLLGCLLLSPDELRDLGKNATATVASVSNLFFSRGVGYFASKADENPLLMTWSLGVEEQFYLVIPLLMVWLMRLRPRLVLPCIGLVAVGSFALSCYQLQHSPMSAFYLLPARAWEIAAGVMLALVEIRASQKRSAAAMRSHPSTRMRPSVVLEGVAWCGLALLLLPFFLLTSFTPFPGPAVLPSVAACFVLLATPGAWVHRRLLSLPPLTFVGRVSYSWYLWHWPLLSFLRIVLGRPLPVSWALAVAVFSLALATLSFYFVERPFRSSRLAPAPLLLRYGAASLLFLAGSFILWRTDGLPGRYPSTAKLDSDKLQQVRDPCLARGNEEIPRGDKVCVGAKTAQREVALWGDSHAAALAPALRSVVATHGYGLEVYALTTCPPLLGAAPAYRDNPAHVAHCIAFNERVLERLQADSSVRTVALEAFWESSIAGRSLRTAGHTEFFPSSDAQETDRIFVQALERTIDALEHSGKHVILFGDVPTFDIDPLWRMRSSRIPARRWLISRLEPAYLLDPGADKPSDDMAEFVRARSLLRVVALDRPEAELWEMHSPLCDVRGQAEMCVYSKGDVSFYMDDNHVTAAGGLVALSEYSADPRFE
jgi:peptidoglycan/LPS O-acetylase OafA/YrhL